MQSLPTNEINPETFLNVYKVYTTLTYKLCDNVREYYEILESYPYPSFVTKGTIEKLDQFWYMVPDLDFERCVMAMGIPGRFNIKGYIKALPYYHEATVFVPAIIAQIRTQVPKLPTDKTSIQHMNFSYTGSDKHGNSTIL